MAPRYEKRMATALGDQRGGESDVRPRKNLLAFPRWQRIDFLVWMNFTFSQAPTYNLLCLQEKTRLIRPKRKILSALDWGQRSPSATDLGLRCWILFLAHGHFGKADDGRKDVVNLQVSAPARWRWSTCRRPESQSQADALVSTTCYKQETTLFVILVRMYQRNILLSYLHHNSVVASPSFVVNYARKGRNLTVPVGGGRRDSHATAWLHRQQTRQAE